MRNYLWGCLVLCMILLSCVRPYFSRPSVMPSNVPQLVGDILVGAFIGAISGSDDEEDKNLRYFTDIKLILIGNHLKEIAFYHGLAGEPAPLDINAVCENYTI